jgi:hypothetical protein
MVKNLCPICYINGEEKIISEDELLCDKCRFIGGKSNYMEREER